MTHTVCDGNIPGCWDENHYPVIFETEVEAWKEIADSMVEKLRQFMNDERDLEETDFSTDEWVQYVYIDPNGVILYEDDGKGGELLYNPSQDTNIIS
jgi:hypothetical protein